VRLSRRIWRPARATLGVVKHLVQVLARELFQELLPAPGQRPHSRRLRRLRAFECETKFCAGIRLAARHIRLALEGHRISGMKRQSVAAALVSAAICAG